MALLSLANSTIIQISIIISHKLLIEMERDDFVLPKGSLVLVTGCNGYIASQIVDHLLQLGYRVRGTVREPKQWLKDYFTDKYGEGKFETATVPKIDVVDAFKNSIKGVDGIIHTVC